jgi:hypothetical protein
MPTIERESGITKTSIAVGFNRRIVEIRIGSITVGFSRRIAGPPSGRDFSPLIVGLKPKAGERP